MQVRRARNRAFGRWTGGWAVASLVILAAMAVSGRACAAGSLDLQSLAKECDGATGKRGDAIGACTEIILSYKLSNTQLAAALRSRGNAYSSAKQWKEAVSDYSRAIALDPSSAYTFAKRGLAYSSLHDYMHALGDFQHAIDLDPNSSAWAYRGDVFTHLGNKEQALLNFGEAIRRQPNWMWPYNDRGELYLDSGDFELAMQDFDAVVRLSPDRPIGWSNRCRTNVMIGHLEQALSDCDRAIGLEPKFINSMVVSGKVSAVQNRALARLKSGQFEKAIEDYTEALTLVPNSAEALFGRALAKAKIGDEAGAVADTTAARTIDGSIEDRFARFGLGR